MDGILNDRYSSMLANSIDHHQRIQHDAKLNVLYDEQNLVLVKTYNLIPFKDGNQWCVLLGKNIQEGIAGFGETPYKAILDFNGAFHRA